jgi:putative DNA primase/helicase
MSSWPKTTLLRESLAVRAAEVAVAVLGEPNRGMSSKRELRFGRHGSLAVVLVGQKAGLWRDHEADCGGDMLALIARERGRGFRDAVEYAEQFIGPAKAPTPPRPVIPATDAEQNRRTALSIWQEATLITGSIASRYLEGRGIIALPSGVDGDVLRFHPSCPYDGERRPCMVALPRDIASNEPRAIQRTALTATGEKLGRRTLGPKAAAAIKLSAHNEIANRLTVGEGCETVLSGMTLGYVPAWALGDAGELAAFSVLPGVKSITILVDHDHSGAGQRAALKCSSRWTDAGREVFRLVPRQPGADVNDLLKVMI